jgi:DNA-binding transcriptional ArsR family regulator
MARQSVSKHLAVLEAANLVTTVRRGREKLQLPERGTASSCVLVMH